MYKTVSSGKHLTPQLCYINIMIHGAEEIALGVYIGQYMTHWGNRPQSLWAQVGPNVNR